MTDEDLKDPRNSPRENRPIRKGIDWSIKLGGWELGLVILAIGFTLGWFMRDFL